MGKEIERIRGEGGRLVRPGIGGLIRGYKDANKAPYKDKGKHSPHPGYHAKTILACSQGRIHLAH